MWQHRDFVKLWTAQMVSLGGSHISRLAMPLTAVVLLQASASEMGIIAALGACGSLLGALGAGPYVDRLPRRAVMVVVDLARALFCASIPLAAFSDHLCIEQLYIVSFLFGLFSVVFDVAYMAFLPTLVSHANLTQANSKLEASRSVVSLVGPGLAGMLVQAITAPVAVLLDGCSFLCSALFLRGITTAEAVPAVQQQRLGWWSEIRAGFRLVLDNRILCSIAGSSATFVFFLQIFSTLRMLYLTVNLGIEPMTLGIVSMIASLSALLGSCLAERSAQYFGVGAVVMGGLCLSGLGNLMVPLAGGSQMLILTLLLLGALLDGIGCPIYNINALSLRQKIIPNELQGRVNAIMRFLVIGLSPLSPLLAGLLGDMIGVRAVLVCAGIGQVLACLWFQFAPMAEPERSYTYAS